MLDDGSLGNLRSYLPQPVARDTLQLVPPEPGGLSPQQSRHLARELRVVTQIVRNLEEKLDGIGAGVERATSMDGTVAAARKAAMARALEHGVNAIVLGGAPRQGTMVHVDGFDEPAWLGRSNV
ncbi:MAG: hypothetical protein ACYS0D_03450, partial [Planctomycetota bacterium]